MTSRLRFLLVYPQAAGFIDDDARLLGRLGDVATFESFRRPRWNEAWRRVRDADVVVGWFASAAHLTCLAAARLQGKPGLTIVTGTDVARLPDIGYGDARVLRGRARLRLVVALSDRILPVSSSIRRELRAVTGLGSRRTEVVYHGIEDPLHGGPLPDWGARSDVLTVGAVKEGNLLRKGLLPFARASRECPDLRFVIAGSIADRAAATIAEAGGANLRIAGEVSRDELVRLYLSARVYVQASRHEGFGVSLAEAMICGAAAVVTKAGALPEVAPASVAVVEDDLSPAALGGAIRRAWRAEGLGARGREHIQRHFSPELRKDAFARQLGQLLPGKGL